MKIGKQIISTVINDREYIIESTGNVGATLTNYNGKVYLNGSEVPSEPGEYKVKSLPNTKLTIRKIRKKNMPQFAAINAGMNRMGINKMTMNMDKSDKINLSKDDDQKTRVIKDDYIMSGMGQRLVGYNIRIKGDLVVSGMNNRVRQGKVNKSLPNLVINGDLVMSGMNGVAETIVECSGDVVNSGMGNYIR